MSSKDSISKALIPGFTDNNRGLYKFFGLVLITSVLNQTSFVFERTMTTSFEQYFKLGNEEYKPELVRSWWFTF